MASFELTREIVTTPKKKGSSAHEEYIWPLGNCHADLWRQFKENVSIIRIRLEMILSDEYFTVRKEQANVGDFGVKVAPIAFLNVAFEFWYNTEFNT